MQRTTMAYVRTAVSIAGLGRTSTSWQVQYACDGAALLMLTIGVSQHYVYGRDMFKKETSAREADLMRTLFSQGRFFHWALLVAALAVGWVGGMAAVVWVGTVPGGVPFFISTTS